MTDADGLVEAMALAMAKVQCERDQKRAVQGGCDIMLLPDGYMPGCRIEVRAALSAISAAGWQVVPKEPTPEMVTDMEESDFESWSLEPGEGRDSVSLDVAYKAALAAAPKLSP